MKTFEFEDEKEVRKVALKLLEGMKKDPTKMPMCIVCEKEHSKTLAAYSPEGVSHTVFFGFCASCLPEDKIRSISNFSELENYNEIMKKVKEKMENGEKTIHLTPKVWRC
ncbi:hypothetical protein A2Z67_03890 [Candidatus Woesebacteria bacterium RBG_13_36_22]|uniref:Uncharacterized protein n=1 Tax=Candidatus Woesebacteria bacterium RBG_13_36_22 TaxID=1802478 RepID=A0A1F7WZE0_9BACT|nr:MAG: hypothetical protein A2Z67_03890 [Candidatus Woesebacteria bacterium RBG_13_36_22]